MEILLQRNGGKTSYLTLIIKLGNTMTSPKVRNKWDDLKKEWSIWYKSEDQRGHGMG